MADEYWKSSPFGEDSIFHPSWEEKQRKESLQGYQGVKILDMYVYPDYFHKNKGMFLPPPSIVKSTNIVSSNSNTVKVAVKVTVLLSDKAYEVKIAQNKSFTKTASRRVLSNYEYEYEATFIVEIAKSFVKNNSQEFTFTASVTDLFTNNVSDTSSVKITVDTNGKVSNTLNQKCLCNRDFTVEEMIEIIYLLKDKFFIKTDREKFFDQGGKETLEEIKINSGKIIDNDEQIKSFTGEINKMFRKFGLNHCKTKIHFLGQMFTETDKLRSVYENRKTVPSNYKGGVDFQGRGMKQITHNYNYLAYFDYVNGTKHYETFDKYRGKENDVKKVISEKIPSNKSNGLTLAFYINTLVPFTKKLSTNLFHAFNSAGWYCTIRNPKVIKSMKKGLSKNDILLVSRAINGNVQKPNNLSDRENATLYLQEYFKYDKECINK